MATYLQGVTDYIPDYQPFQPDLNFYSNLLQAKQTQYDTNWKQLNNLYGQLYNADLTHDGNIKKKDELLKQIDFNVKRVSGLDLSLEQNVNQAMQVFRPFYEDKYLMKDMAWTKNWKNTYNYANNLKKSQDKDQRAQWWNVGVQGLELRRQMFKDANLEETLNMANAQYTPFVNATQTYFDLAKKYGVGKIEEKPDASGLYMVRKKNGELVLPTLQDMFLSEYQSNPGIQDMYRERAFVERMNYAYQNKDKFGSVLEAEKDYIKTKYDYIKEYASRTNAKAQNESTVAENLKADLDKNVSQGNVNPQQQSYAEQLQGLLTVTSVNAKGAQDLNDQINDKQSTSVERGNGNDDILSDIELARLKVDAGYASIAAEQDILGAAKRYADINSELVVKANPVGLEFLRHKHATQRQSQAARDRRAEIQQQHENAMFQKAVDHNVKLGIWSWDQNGQLNTNPQANGYSQTFTTPDGTTTKGKFTFDELQKMSKEQMIKSNATGGTQALMNMIQMGVNGPDGEKFTAAQLAKLITKLNPSDPTANRILKEGSSPENLKQIKQVWDNVWNSYSKDPEGFVLKTAGSGQIYNLHETMKSWVAGHSGSSLARQFLSNNDLIKLEQTGRAQTELMNTRIKNYDNIKAKFSQDLNYIVKEVKAKDPKTYANVTDAKIEQAIDLMMNRYILDGNGHTEEFNKIADQVDDQISSILGFSIGKSTNRASEAKWYNYVFPLTNIPRILGDGRENVAEGASWVKDVFDQSFDELTNMDPKNGGLIPYFASARKVGPDNEYGLATDTTNIKVAPGVYWDPGNQSASGMFKTILGTLWNQNNKEYRITTGGNILPSEDGWENTGIAQNEALAIVRELQGRLNTDDKLEPFFVGATSMSMENEKLGSMKLMAPRDVIEKVIKGMSGEDADEKALKRKIDDIYQNGITFIAPKQTWESNTLFNMQFATPTEMALRTGPITYVDPRGNGKYRIERVSGTGDYIGHVELYEMLDNGDKIVHKDRWDVDVRSGKTVDLKEQESFNMLQKADILNSNNTFNRIHRSGDQNAKLNAQQNFGATPNNAFWNYNKD
jgi:hypothetical protein